MIPFRVWFATCCLAVVIGAPHLSPAQMPEQVRLAFRNIRSDDIPNNATIATDWIFTHRSRITNELLDELYRTDRQGRDVLLSALMATPGFQPDERFCRLLVSRLNEEDRFVSNEALRLHTHWRAWKFINAHYDQFKTLLLENFRTTNDMWCLWGSVCLWQHRGEGRDLLDKFDPHVWETMARSLQGDKIPYNASQAVRVYLTLGKASLPHLEPLAKTGDAQTQDYANAMIEAMNGSRRAYGYLGSQLALDTDIFPGDSDSPGWIVDEVNKWDPSSAARQRYTR